jgi:hypothetical protein
MPKDEEIGGSLGNGASSLRMSQFIEALIRVDLHKQKAIESDKGVSVGIFGWCLTGHHDLCYKEIPDQKCTCLCHNHQTKGEVSE